MSETTRLTNLILDHWCANRPMMVAQLKRAGQLEATLEAAESRAADLLYEFLSVRKMQYQDAWELAMRECLLPQEPSSMKNPSEILPATSA
jgi:hypothetical protein